MSASDDRFPAVQSPGEQLATHRERLKSLRETTDRHENELGELGENFGKLMSEMGDVKTALREMSAKLDPILAQYWNEHPSRAHAPSSPPKKESKPLDTRVMLAAIGALVVMSHVVDHLVTALVETKPAAAQTTAH
jgi:hypothetical protein